MLPNELILRISNFLGESDLRSLRLVCREWSLLPLVFRQIHSLPSNQDWPLIFPRIKLDNLPSGLHNNRYFTAARHLTLTRFISADRLDDWVTSSFITTSVGTMMFWDIATITEKNGNRKPFIYRDRNVNSTPIWTPMSSFQENKLSIMNGTRLGTDLASPKGLTRPEADLASPKGLTRPGADLVSPWPPNLESIKLELNNWNRTTDLRLPPTVTKIDLGQYYNPDIVLPPKLRTLKLSREVPSSLPPGLQKIVFGNGFDRRIVLPAGLRKVIFGHEFNNGPTYSSAVLPLDLPTSLISLTLGEYFNQPINLPPNLRHLIFSWYGDLTKLLREPPPTNDRFNYPLDLPPTLVTLILGDKFVHPLNLPPNLEILVLGNNFNRKLVLPPKLREVRFGRNFNNGVISYGAVDHERTLIIPASVINLRFGSQFGQPLVFASPSSLVSLVYDPILDQDLSSLLYLRDLTIGGRFNGKLVLPESLRHLTIGNSFNQELVLGPNLVTLQVGHDFNNGGLICNEEPSQNSKVQRIKRKDYASYQKWSHPLVIPASLRKLVLGKKFYQPIRIPNTLEQLIFAHKWGTNRYNAQRARWWFEHRFPWLR